MKLDEALQPQTLPKNAMVTKNIDKFYIRIKTQYMHSRRIFHTLKFDGL